VLPLCGLALREVPVIAAPFFVLVSAGWVFGIWRVALVGVYVGDDGIKIRHVWSTQVVPWAQLNRAWAGQADDFDAWQIRVSGRDPERDHPTPIWRTGSRVRHRNRIVLDQQEFTAALAALNRRP
jgi:hypothetical protein